MGVTTTNNKPINPRGNDQSPKGYNRAALYSGKALDFDGVNDYVDGGTLGITGYTQMSISFYMNVDTTTQDFRLISIKYIGVDDIRIFHSVSVGAGVLNFSLDDGDVDNIGVNFETNQWYHVVMTHDGTTLKAYFNGVEQASTASTFDYANANGLFYIGRYTGGAVTFYDGEASNVKIFNTALTAAQVADLYNNPEKVVPTGLESNLKLWLPMMEGAGTTAYDGSGNGNHGTISGATYVNGIGAPVAQSAVMDWNKGSNLTPYSEDFSAYSKSGVTITSNQLTSPNGLLTGSKGLETTANSYRDVVAKPFGVTSTNSYTLSAFVKNGLGRDGVYLYTNDGSGNGRCAKFNLSTGAYIGNAGAGGWTAFDSYGIESAPNGWYRIHATLNSSNGGTKTFNVGLSDNTNDALGSYIGDATKGLYVWGYQFQQTAAVGPYIPTIATAQTSEVLLPQGLTTGRDITGVNLFENVRKQGALNLDGNSWAEVHDNESLDITDAITLEAWVYWDGTSGKGIIGRWDNTSNKRSYLIYIATSSRFRFYVSSNGTTNLNQQNNSVVSTGWNHVVGVYDGSKIYTYLNGAVDGSQNYSSDIYASDVDVEIGRYDLTSVNAYPNDIAQPRIYNRALTAEEVQRSYDSNKNIYTNS